MLNVTPEMLVAAHSCMEIHLLQCPMVVPKIASSDTCEGSCMLYSPTLLEAYCLFVVENVKVMNLSMARRAGVSKVGDQIASWDTGSAIGIKAVLLHPFKPLVCTADDIETIRYCYYFYLDCGW